MSRERYFVERRQGPDFFVPIAGQPAGGFASPRELMDWLVARGAVRKRIATDGDVVYEGWGGPRGYYCRKVPVVESPELPFTVGRYGTLFGVERVLRPSLWRKLIARLRRS